jgi:hypothetical protein
LNALCREHLRGGREISRPRIRGARHAIRLRYLGTVASEDLLDRYCFQRKDDIAEIVVLELISFNTIENDSAARPSFSAYCWNPRIALCADLDLARLAIHFVRDKEIVVE